jgi:hypothetical protein
MPRKFSAVLTLLCISFKYAGGQVGLNATWISPTPDCTTSGNPIADYVSCDQARVCNTGQFERQLKSSIRHC